MRHDGVRPTRGRRASAGYPVSQQLGHDARSHFKLGRESQVSDRGSHGSNWQTLKVRLPVTVQIARLPAETRRLAPGSSPVPTPSPCFILPVERGPHPLKVTPPCPRPGSPGPAGAPAWRWPASRAPGHRQEGGLVAMFLQDCSPTGCIWDRLTPIANDPRLQGLMQ